MGKNKGGNLTGNPSFRVVEHPEFIKLFHLLRKGCRWYRKMTGGKILDDVYETEHTKLEPVLNDKKVCLSVDGWSNGHNEPMSVLV